MQPETAPAETATDSGWLLRGLSAVPFVIAGAIGALASVTWLIVLVFGVGTERGSAWQWAAGRTASDVLPQMALLLALGAASAAVLIGSMWAGLVSLRDTQPRWFWPAAEGICAALGLALLAGRAVAPETLVEIGLSSRDWYFALGVVAYSAIVIGMRQRRASSARDNAERREKDG